MIEMCFLVPALHGNTSISIKIKLAKENRRTYRSLQLFCIYSHLMNDISLIFGKALVIKHVSHPARV